MAKPLRTIQLFYDVISPYSWVAFEVLCRYRHRWSIDLQLCPFFLSGIMAGSHNRPPGVVPAKAVYMGKDILTLKEYYQIPFRLPSDFKNTLFKKGSLPTQRFLIAAKRTYPDHLESLSRQLWIRIWSRDEDITEDDSLRTVCECVGLSAKQANNLIGQIDTDEIKEELKRSTQEALNAGAFGAPFVIAHIDGRQETFFGEDRMELLAFRLGEKWEGPLLQYKASL